LIGGKSSGREGKTGEIWKVKKETDMRGKCWKVDVK
jgi:hypothetical protein